MKLISAGCLVYVLAYATSLPLPKEYGRTTIYTDHGPLSSSSSVFGSRLGGFNPSNAITRPYTTNGFRPNTPIFQTSRSVRRRAFTFPIAGFGRALEMPETMWPNGVFLPPNNIQDLSFETGDRGHLTPDYSNGLDNPDPYLLTGPRAKQVVDYLFSKELFYGEYPHTEALLRNQVQRQYNGLEGNTLSSNRPGSPFYRY